MVRSTKTPFGAVTENLAHLLERALAEVSPHPRFVAEPTPYQRDQWLEAEQHIFAAIINLRLASSAEATVRSASDELRRRITERAADHDVRLRAAAWLICESVVIHKIASYVEDDGWIDWVRLAGDLMTGVPWSGGEQRVAMVACSLSGTMSDLAADGQYPPVVPGDVLPWTLARLLVGLSDMDVVLDAIKFAVTGRQQ